MSELELAVATLRSQPYGFFVTTPSPGSPPNARLVQPLRIDDDATIWFVTSPSTRKAGELEAASGACYAVEHRECFAYACVRGRATATADAELAASLWDPGLDAFFPDGPRGQDAVVVCLRAEVVEHMSFAAGVHPDPYGLRSAEVPVLPRA